MHFTKCCGELFIKMQKNEICKNYNKTRYLALNTMVYSKRGNSNEYVNSMWLVVLFVDYYLEKLIAHNELYMIC